MNKFLCWVFGHQLWEVQKFGSTASRFHCDRCEKDFAMHHARQTFLEWDDDFADLYEQLGYYILKI